jgi:putative endopeptidase
MTARRTAALALLVLAPVLVTAESAPPSVGIDLAGIDKTVPPGQDFFTHANGAWIKATEIAPERASEGTWAKVVERTNAQTAELIREVAGGKSPAGSVEQKVGDYFSAWMDEAAIEKLGREPLQPTLDRIAAIRDRKALSRHLGTTLRADVDAFNATNFYTPNLFGLWVAQDIEHPSRYTPFLLQGGLDMPDRAYYLDDSPRLKDLREKHVAHVAAMLGLAGVPDARERAQAVAALEVKIAQGHAPREETERPQNGLNRWSRADFDTKAPGIDWDEYFGAAGLGARKEFVAWQPRAVTALSALVASEPLPAWKDYLVFRAADRYSAVLPAAFGEQSFAFHGTALAGVPKRRDRWKRAVDATSNVLGDAVGQLYVAKHFPPASKARIEGMVANIKAAFATRIDALAWMAPETKAQAKAKLEVLKVGVGYPDRWTDYSGVDVRPGDAFGNFERADLDGLRRSVAKLGKPVDRGEWVLNAQTVNAVNLPAMNAMNFPAGILQPPFFDPTRPEAMDYGAIGSVIGHEIVHSFDDQGALFDAQGRLRNWWTPADKEHFDAAAARLVKQYDTYKPFPDLGVNGKLTLGENIADVAGLSATYDAYRMSLGGKAAPEVGGLTGDQQFFLAFGQVWRNKTREASLRAQLMGDGHSPGQFRVQTVRNLDPWYAAFDVKPGQALYLAPEERVRIW